MDYAQINLFLDRVKKTLSFRDHSNTVIAETITKHISFPITVGNIKIKGTLIYIQGSPIMRNEVLIHKQGILSDIGGLLPESRFTDIR